jgi:hypothetical protein
MDRKYAIEVELSRLKNQTLTCTCHRKQRQLRSLIAVAEQRLLILQERKNPNDK